MTERIQQFTDRQTMTSRSYEIYHYRDLYPNEVALHHHDFYEAYLFLSGDVDYIIEGRVHHVQPGDVLVISPGEFHQPMFRGEHQRYERYVVWIDKTYLEQTVIYSDPLNSCFARASKYHANLLRPDEETLKLIQQILDSILREQQERGFAWDLMCDICILQVMVMLNRLAAQEHTPPELQSRSSSVVGKVMMYINEHYREDLSLDLLANKFFISKYHLSREFNRVMGTSVYRYIIQRRLAMGRQMLASGAPSSEVYQHCGFGDYSSFYRAFKSEYGMSPKEYATQQKKDMELAARRGRERVRLPAPEE